MKQTCSASKRNWQKTDKRQNLSQRTGVFFSHAKLLLHWVFFFITSCAFLSLHILLGPTPNHSTAKWREIFTWSHLDTQFSILCCYERIVVCCGFRYFLTCSSSYIQNWFLKSSSQKLLCMAWPDLQIRYGVPEMHCVKSLRGKGGTKFVGGVKSKLV